MSTLPVSEVRGTRTTQWVSALTGWLGSFPAIIMSVLTILLWLLYVPFVHHGFLNTNYQLLINTTTTIITFVMVFIIQSTQNRDGRALQTKLDAILIALQGDHSHLMSLEDLPERVIKQVQQNLHEEVSDVVSEAVVDGVADGDQEARTRRRS